MQQSRRSWLSALGGAAAILAAKPLRSFAQTPQPKPSPNAPNPNFPPGLNGPDIRPDDENKVRSPQNQKEIREDVEKLFEMISELKDQVEKTDLNATIPVTFVKKAQQIEKLAKHVKDLAKG